MQALLAAVLSLLVVVSAGASLAQATAEAHAGRGTEKRTKVVLTKRATQPYENSGYSFFFASRDPKVHRNYVDLLYGNCGLLHFNAYGGSRNRVASLGDVEYASVHAVPDHGWFKTSVRPRKGQVYVFDGGLPTPDGIEKYAVKFVITDLDSKSLTIEWTPLGEMPRAPGRTTRMGDAGAAGLCGMPPHGEE
ncbi:MAG TPA: hypothetical protein VFI25_05825 [Planctomycetota bacterium]|nr:hypothetical protein [Planctomycetota bacterium]